MVRMQQRPETHPRKQSCSSIRMTVVLNMVSAAKQISIVLGFLQSAGILRC